MNKRKRNIVNVDIFSKKVEMHYKDGVKTIYGFIIQYEEIYKGEYKTYCEYIFDKTIKIKDPYFDTDYKYNSDIEDFNKTLAYKTNLKNKDLIYYSQEINKNLLKSDFILDNGVLKIKEKNMFGEFLTKIKKYIGY